MIKQNIYDETQALLPLFEKAARFIWHNPEVSGTEKKSSEYFKNILAEEGFKITDSKTLDYAFYAEYGSGSPVLALLGEYDALPVLSQEAACTVKKPVEEGGAGHGCGHNLLGSAQLTGAIAVKRFLEKSGISGTVRFYDCPREELLDGKVKMIAEGMLEGCDAALSWHPMDAVYAHDSAYLANTSMKFYFSGKTSHAAFAPELGRSALDAVELMSVGCNYLREHVPDKTRIHYSTDGGGFAPNIVPDKASAWYFVGAPKISAVKDVAARVEKIAKGAAMMTETTVSAEHGCGCCEFKENTAFGDLIHTNLIEADAPKYTAEETEFAQKLQAALDEGVILRSRKSYGMENASIYMGVGRRDLWKSCMMNASSDTGDVSYIMPTGLFTTACWPIGCSPHTWQATASAGSSFGEKGGFYAAKVIAGTCYDLLTKPEVLAKIKKEFKNRDDGDYSPMLGD